MDIIEELLVEGKDILNDELRICWEIDQDLDLPETWVARVRHR